MNEWHLCEPGDLDDCAKQCNRGHLGSCVRLGNIYFTGKGVPKNAALAAELYELPCANDFAVACLNRALIYESEGDPEHAAKDYDRACCDGQMAGCDHLADLYEAGKGVPRDVARAVVLHEKACDGGELRGCSNLGVLYMNGTGMARDETRAVHLFEKACAGGNAGGCGNLGSSYLTGRGVPRDAVRAMRLYEQACNAGVQNFCTLAKESEKAPP